ncbi:hypothetical protein N7447_002562, partial [Penicillium robsamsonii]|uniref:uncharacterized protein n=1 Tax=Penicillium robsamsonii TaxID=1792511 RepID=UPI002546777C
TIKESTFLKAAWILTLRCFHPEVTSLSFVEEPIPRSDPPIAFTMRVNPDWDVSSLLEALEMKGFSKMTRSSQSYGAQLSDIPQSRHVCNSALRYVTIADRLLTPSTSLDEKIELVVVKSNDRMSARIRNSENIADYLNDSMLWTF